MSTVNKTKTSSSGSHKPSASINGRRRGNRSKTQTRLSRRTCFMRSILLCLAMAALFIVRFPGLIEQNAHTGGDIEVKLDHVRTLPLQPKRTRIQGLDHYYMFPPANATSDGQPKGLLLHLHACKETGLEFFTFPEHRVVAFDALQKGLVVFSPTSYDRKSGCYTSEDANELLKTIVTKFVRRNHLRHLPRVGLGHSSGGTFLSFLHKDLKLESIAVYNSPEDYFDMHVQNDTLIPTAYLTMSSDESITERMTANMKRLQEKNVTSYLYRVSPKPFTQKLCEARLPELTDNLCERLFKSIRKDYSGLLDADGFVIEADAGSKKWLQLFHSLEMSSSNFCPIGNAESLQYYHTEQVEWTRGCWMRAVVEEEMKTCHGYHAMTAQYHDEILNFLVSNSKMNEQTTSEP